MKRTTVLWPINTFGQANRRLLDEIDGADQSCGNDPLHEEHKSNNPYGKFHRMTVVKTK